MNYNISGTNSMLMKERKVYLAWKNDILTELLSSGHYSEWNRYPSDYIGPSWNWVSARLEISFPDESAPTIIP